MVLPGTSKYRLKKKTSSDLEFEETTPFIHNSGEKILGSNERVSVYSKFTISIIIVLIGVLSLQTFKLQVIDANNFAILAENNRLKEVTFHADRGIIYDKNKNFLVKNKAIFDLVAIPKEVTRDANELKQIVENIAKITKRDPAEISGNLEKIDRTSYKAELILDNLDITSAMAIESLGEKIPGFEIKNNAIREYPDAKYFSNIIGYTGRVNQKDLSSDDSYETADFIGKGGLEAYYEKYLRGEKGKESLEIDANGRVIFTLNKTETKTGGNLILSLDGNLQKKLQDTLAEMSKKIKIKEKNNGAAAAIAMDPRNGKILALVSLPAYDNNIFADPANKNKISAIFQDPLSPMFDRAISGTYPPGSTIKPVMGTAALSEGIINKNTIIEDRGVITAYNQDFYGWNRSGLGPMNIISAMAQSSDIFFYTVGGGFGNFNGLGVEKIDEYFWKFNLGKKLGIDLPNESNGLVPTKEWKLANIGKNEPWTIGNTYHISIGQGYLLTTPLQVALWTSVFANSGTLYKPYLVDKIISSEDGSVTKEFAPQIINDNIAEQKYINIIRDGMREVVVSGSGGSLRDVKVKVAGKTGTAEYGNAGKTHAWFTAFAPYDDPEIVLTILIEGGGEGGINAVPVAKDVLSWYFEDK
ncbi:MAG: penicillin-binding protein 2 [bacterium]|nr:penicillin-binding protein 2 [bacterium]